ncbi:hypothetical protein [Patulibacter defluvii]|uniref:hypothetical protein n=1 Tax=Patulibacter defluvii TaxID=3095358 RepID=UPI002A751EE2|nr:hypothetical protein [Patulibacter sp. DM4]
MAIVRRTSELPISAETAFALAQKPDLFRYVVAPFLRVPRLDLPARLEAGAEGSARLWWLGVVPSWRHHLRLVHIGPGELRTVEHGGPVRRWNHHLRFEPLGADRCRYTDEIELEDGLRGAPTRLFARLIFRYRHRRWRALARVLA